MYFVNKRKTKIKGMLINNRGMKNKNERAHTIDKNIENSKNVIAYTISLAV